MTVLALEHFLRLHIKRPLTDVVLWSLGTLHVVALLSFLIVLALVAPTRAEDQAAATTQACAGTNLVDELKASDPAAFAKVTAEADAVANGRGTFWKIEKQGLAPSWLLGTMHVTDPRVLDMPTGAAAAFASAQTVVVESDEILDEKRAAAAILMQPELTMFTDGSKITDHLSPEDTKILEDGLRQRGLQLATVSRMKSWMIAAFVALPACELARKAQGAAFLDKKIAEDAVAAGKQVKGLETMAEQLGAMNDLPIDFHMRGLVSTIELGDRMDDVMTTMTELYLQGEIGLIMPLLNAVAEEEAGVPADYATFEQRIVTDRNHVMAEGSAPILADGNAFIAVGALHLPGDEGLVELLRKQGFTLTRVN